MALKIPPTTPFKKVWNRACAGSRDSWGVEYVYEHGARRIWNAARRYERKQLQSGKNEGAK